VAGTRGSGPSWLKAVRDMVRRLWTAGGRQGTDISIFRSDLMRNDQLRPLQDVELGVCCNC
jgi:hypothetical protein